jgi:hypothetical protein
VPAQLPAPDNVETEPVTVKNSEPVKSGLKSHKPGSRNAFLMHSQEPGNVRMTDIFISARRAAHRWPRAVRAAQATSLGAPVGRGGLSSSTVSLRLHRRMTVTYLCPDCAYGWGDHVSVPVDHEDIWADCPQCSLARVGPAEVHEYDGPNDEHWVPEDAEPMACATAPSLSGGQRRTRGRALDLE